MARSFRSWRITVMSAVGGNCTAENRPRRSFDRALAAPGDPDAEAEDEHGKGDAGSGGNRLA